MLKTALISVAFTIVAIAVLLGAAFPHAGDAFESLCIKGRISGEQAEKINNEDWLRTPSYCEDELGTDKKNGKRYVGQTDCRARKYDRILRAECSQMMKVAQRGD